MKKESTVIMTVILNDRGAPQTILTTETGKNGVAEFNVRVGGGEVKSKPGKAGERPRFKRSSIIQLDPDTGLPITDSFDIE